MARVLLLLFAILCSVLFGETALDIRKKKLTIRSLGQCKGQSHLPLVFYGFAPKYIEKTDQYFATLKFNNKVEISKDLSIVFNFWKCDASGNPDSCEYVLKDRNITNICKHLEAKDQLWTEFFTYVNKPLHCPIKPGEYSITNFPIKPDLLKYMPVTDAMWKVQLFGYDKGRQISCVLVVIQILPFYVKRQ